MPLPSEPRRKFPDYVAPTKVHYDGARPRAIQVRTCRLITNLAGARREHMFDKSTVRIGAMDDNDIVITDETVSRYHCRIVQEEAGYLLCDLGSTNGTFVNGVRVREAFLQTGSTIRLGQSEVQFFASQEKVEIVPSPKNRLGDIIGNSGSHERKGRPAIPQAGEVPVACGLGCGSNRRPRVTASSLDGSGAAQGEYVLRILGKVGGAGFAAEIEGLASDLAVRTLVLYGEDDSAYRAVGVLTELGAGLEGDVSRPADRALASAPRAAGEAWIGGLPGCRRAAGCHRGGCGAGPLVGLSWGGFDAPGAGRGDQADYKQYRQDLRAGVHAPA